MKAFISHSPKNKGFVSKLRKELLNAGIEVFQFETNSKAGDKMLSTIKEAIRISDFIIVIISKESVKSDWINFEISTALLNETN